MFIDAFKISAIHTRLKQGVEDVLDAVQNRLPQTN